MEIPLLIRILRSREALKITVSNVLALDYFGALFASCAFPLILVPYLGLLRTAFLFGLVNLAVAAVGLRVMSGMLTAKRKLAIWAAVSSAVMIVGFVGAGKFTSFLETFLYQDKIVLAKQTQYQRLIVTRWHDDLRLFIDGHLQFSSVDEHRYHECLVHPAMAASQGAERALILGGGDGMAARELLKYERIKQIDLVDLDVEMIRLFKDHSTLAALSDSALSNPRMRIHIGDAGKFLEQSTDFWDIIVLDLPDPNNLSLARLYTTSLYKLIDKHLSRFGIVVTQATSPFYASEAFWCIAKTFGETPLGPEGSGRFFVYPYHVYVPSFGDWGFVIASRRELKPKDMALKDDISLKFLTREILPTLFIFSKDLVPAKDIQANRLDNQIISRYYRNGWQRFDQ